MSCVFVRIQVLIVEVAWSPLGKSLDVCHELACVGPAAYEKHLKDGFGLTRLPKVYPNGDLPVLN